MVLSLERWIGKVAVVTGAASGIGRAIAAQLVEEGIIVAGLDLNPEPIKERSKLLAGKKGQLHAIKADIRNEEEVKAAFEWITKNLGPIYILCNNAGLTKYGRLIDGNTKDFQTVLDTNVLGLCICTREAVKIMKANNINGHIINTNSNLGHRVVDLQMNVYPASKFAVTALTETLRQELNNLGTKIKVTSISPTLTETELAFGKNAAPEFKNIFGPLPKLKPEDVADGVLYVLSTPEHVQVHELTLQHVEWKL